MIAPKMKDLRALSDDEIISRYDEIATHTQVGTDFYMEELNRRVTERQTKVITRLTIVIAFLTAVLVLLTTVLLFKA